MHGESLLLSFVDGKKLKFRFNLSRSVLASGASVYESMLPATPLSFLCVVVVIARLPGGPGFEIALHALILAACMHAVL